MARKKKKQNGLLNDWWQRFEYKHTTLAIMSVTLFVLALDTAVVQAAIDYMEHLGYLGIFISGVMFVSFFTAAPSVVLLIHLTEFHPWFVVALVAGAGAALGDFIIFRFLDEKIGHELYPLAKKLHLTHFIDNLRKNKARLRTMLAGAFIIASPLPDEAGIALLGLSHISWVALLFVTFVLNTTGIALILLAA